ncbi:hypothetical protein RKD38_001448 [Streptomyces ambofaciens]
MSRARKQKQQQKKKDPAAEDCAKGVQLVWANPALAAMEVKLCREEECKVAPRQGLVRVSSNGRVHLHPTRHAEPAEWAWAIAHALIHLGFGHVPAANGERVPPDRYDLAARCTVVNRFLQTFPVGRTPDHLPPAYPDGDEERIAAAWRREGGIPAAYEHCGTAGGEPDQLLVPWDGWNLQVPDWQLAFAHALTRTMSTALDLAGGRRDAMLGGPTRLHPWQQALSWFVSSYPLLGGIASGITLVADAELARAHGISVAAVNAEAGEIYVNPLRRYDDEEWRFILAHEMLHAALRHGDRCGTRDPYLFNVACDYVVNGWLVEMRVGTMPEGLLHDPELAGLSAEEVYDRITVDLRRMRRLSTLRGKGVGDVLGAPLGAPRDHVDLDGFYRRGLAQGFDLHQQQERGFLPGGLIERRSAPSATRRCPGTPASPAGSTSSCPAPSRSGRTRAPRGARPPPPASRAPDGTSRPRRSPAAPSASSWTPPAPWTAPCWARRSAPSPPTPRPATCPPPASCSATPRRTTPGSCP